MDVPVSFDDPATLDDVSAWTARACVVLWVIAVLLLLILWRVW